MSAQQKVALAQLDTQAFALMGRLHVILRRESGRVIDIEYMRRDPAYCTHVLELAAQASNDALPDICARLKEIFFAEGGLFRMQESRPLLAPHTAPPGASGSPAQTAGQAALPSPLPGAQEGSEQTYIGRLR